MSHADTCGDGVMDIPEIQYVRNGGVALAYQVLGAIEANRPHATRRVASDRRTRDRPRSYG